MSDDFTPTELTVEAQRETLTNRLRDLESQRLTNGLELEAVNAISEAPEREQALATDRANYAYAVEGLDRRIELYRDALAKLQDKVVQPA
jgi:hypothetical protein